jgi:hypothetical protein
MQYSSNSGSHRFKNLDNIKGKESEENSNKIIKK